MTPSGAYRRAHAAQSPFFYLFHPKDAIRHNRDISEAWTFFLSLTDRRASRKRVWSASTTRSAIMFGRPWKRKPRRGRTFSRPGRDLMPRNNSWQISKTRWPRLLTSPAASLGSKNGINEEHPINPASEVDKAL